MKAAPSGWRETRLRYAATLNPSKSEARALAAGTEVSFLPMEAVREDGTFDLSQTRAVEDVAGGYTFFRDGDVLLAKITPCFENGKAALVAGLHSGFGFGSTEFHVLRARAGLDPRFLFYVTRSQPFMEQGTASMFGAGGQKRVPTEFLQDYRMMLPTLAEQHIIADFLNRETARIDALVAKQEEFISALVSHRLAFITEAVTRGLHAPEGWQCTGTDALPSLPSHWRISRVKHLCSNVVDCLHTTPHYNGDLLYPCVRTADIEPGRLLLSQTRLVSEEVYQERIARLRPREGDILYSREGERFGIAALVPPGIDLCLGQRMMMFRAREEHCSAYLMWVLNSAPTLHQVQQQVFGATSPHINIGAIVNFVVPVPPREEQERIAAHIDASVARLRILEVRAAEIIERLREHRAALITAAVTGGIVAARPLADHGPRVAA
ncbi:restriction endonuclease subunit S [Falsiroseomonas oryziterrae]|uniref:restriction endonuclease subunit S n=1 Tax=Falsiroseomonas oryziterrae TaxID=2911368 RepID=UPI001F00BDC4|nr:restriction endonuclease subunit S [Roseomonas sp. NPKOSM-4]